MQNGTEPPAAGRGISILTIEGGIGVGKSTAIAALKKQRPDLVFVDEPVDLWEKHGLLGAMYSGELSRGVFQHMAIMTLAAPIMKAIRSGATAIVTERSPWSNLKVFAHANLPEGSWDRVAYELTFSTLMEALEPNLSLHLVYLAAPVATLQTRVARRGRASEETEEEVSAIPKEYMRKLDALHEKLWDEASVPLYRTKTRIDASQSPFHVADELCSTVTRLIGEEWGAQGAKRAREE